MYNILQISITQKCSKCGAYRKQSKYNNGLRRKEVFSIPGVKCKHKWEDLK